MSYEEVQLVKQAVDRILSEGMGSAPRGELIERVRSETRVPERDVRKAVRPTPRGFSAGHTGLPRGAEIERRPAELLSARSAGRLRPQDRGYRGLGHTWSPARTSRSISDATPVL